MKNEFFLSEFGRDYLVLGLRIGKLIEGYIDAYYGPQELKEKVDNEDKKSPKNLIVTCKNLRKELPNQSFIEERFKFIKRILESMETSLEIISGVEIPFLEQVYRIYDIKPELVDDSVFYNLVEKIDEFYQGSGNLDERLNVVRKRRILTDDKIEESFKKAYRITHELTQELYGNLLAKSEQLKINFVNNEPWSAYNWYLGEYKSRIDINIDVPISLTNILELISHEGYPGHHTERIVKEKLLYHEQQRFEHSILIIPTPGAVISEGLAMVGIDVLFSLDEKVKIALEELCPAIEEEFPLDKLIAEREIFKDLRFLGNNNLAIHAHVDGWTDDQLVKYGSDFGFRTKKSIRQSIKFIRNPIWSTYVFNYSYGADLIRKKYGNRPNPKDFEKLLTRPILPSDLT